LSSPVWMREMATLGMMPITSSRRLKAKASGTRAERCDAHEERTKIECTESMIDEHDGTITIPTRIILERNNSQHRLVPRSAPLSRAVNRLTQHIHEIVAPMFRSRVTPRCSSSCLATSSSFPCECPYSLLHLLPLPATLHSTRVLISVNGRLARTLLTRGR
jgi:hypothetical protein